MFLKRRRDKNLIGYSVFTQSGIKLGYVWKIENDTFGNFKNILVKKRFLKIYFGKIIPIHKSQILKISKRKVIVKDTYLLIDEKELKTAYVTTI